MESMKIQPPTPETSLTTAFANLTLTSRLPPEILHKIARLAGPITTLKMRYGCRATRCLIKREDVMWSKAGWILFHRGERECGEWSIRYWHSEVILALAVGFDVDGMRDAMQGAATRGDVSTLGQLGNLDVRGVTTSQKERILLECLHLAIAHGHSVALRTLLALGSQDGTLVTPILPRYQSTMCGVLRQGDYECGLHLAASMGTAEMVGVLLECRTYNQEELGLALREGVFRAKTGVVRRLLHAGLDVTDKEYDPYTASTVLETTFFTANTAMEMSMASSSSSVGLSQGCSPIKKALIETPPNTIDLLSLAVQSRNTEILRLLLRAGVPVQPPASHQALSFATQKGDADLVSILLALGAHYQSNSSEPVTQPAAPHQFTASSALRHACYKGHTFLVKLLLQSGHGDPHDLNGDALYGAIQNSHTEVVKLLLLAGMEVTNQYPNALYFACHHGRVDIVRLLLDAGVDVHFDGEKCLVGAVAGGHREVVRVLLKAGACISSAREDVVRLARGRNDGGMVELLERWDMRSVMRWPPASTTER
ncbi:hypothetical protein HDV00_006603 [Rhizophlyctis rosea]|nr:hypothetical protein HDV00_006603 [Rhizophlyctis rosea]